MEEKGKPINGNKAHLIHLLQELFVAPDYLPRTLATKEASILQQPSSFDKMQILLYYKRKISL